MAFLHLCVQEYVEGGVLWLDSRGPTSSARPADQPSSIIIAPITLLMMIVIMVMTADSRVFGTQERKQRKTGGRKPGSAQMFHTKRKSTVEITAGGHWENCAIMSRLTSYEWGVCAGRAGNRSLSLGLQAVCVRLFYSTNNFRVTQGSSRRRIL